MICGCGIFWILPKQLISLFSTQPEILAIGIIALRIISLSFVPAAVVIMLTTYFQGINRGRASIRVTVLRQIVLLVPLAWLFHFRGLEYVWLTFPVTEMLSLFFAVWQNTRTGTVKEFYRHKLCCRSDEESCRSM